MKIDTNNIPDFLEKPQARQHPGAKALTNKDADISLQTDYATLIEQAKQAPSTQVDAVGRARQLLQSGELESPSNIRSAAENILKYGI